MKKRKCYLFVFFLFSYSFLFAQTDEQNIQLLFTTENIVNLEGGGGYYIKKKEITQEENVNLYLDENWQKGKLITNEGELVQAECRYRIYDGEMQVKSKKGEVFAVYPNKVKAVSINEQVFIPTPFSDEFHKTKLGFFELLVHGEISLLQRYVMTKKEADYNPALNTGSKKEQYITEKILYYYQKNKLASKLKKTKKAIMAAFPKHKNSLSSYIKKNKLNLKKIEDQKQLFTYLNSLLNSKKS